MPASIASSTSTASPTRRFDGIQNFPPEMNLNNEIHRFGRAGELYTQPNLNREKLSALLQDMATKGVAWSPTMSTYEATRDLIKAQNLPWYKDYLHPSLEEYYVPSHDTARHVLDRLDRNAGSALAEELRGVDGRAPRVRA